MRSDGVWCWFDSGGKVTGITKFGAFVSLPESKSGLVHISGDRLFLCQRRRGASQGGQEVKVKVIGIDENGRINLSIKKAMDPPPPGRSGDVPPWAASGSGAAATRRRLRPRSAAPKGPPP